MDANTLLQTLVNSAPNLVLAVWFIVRQQKTIDALLENQTKLIDRLLGYVDKDKQAVNQIVAANTQSTQVSANGVPH